MSTTQTDLTPETHPLPDYAPPYQGVMMLAGDKTTGRRMILICPTVEELAETWEELSELKLDPKRTQTVVCVSRDYLERLEATNLRVITENTTLRAEECRP